MIQPTNDPLATTPPISTMGALAMESGESAALLDETGTANGATAPTGMRDRLHRIAGSLHRGIDTLEQKLDATSQKLVGTQAQGAEQAGQYSASVRTRIEAKPLQSVGIALGAGLVLSKLFGGKKRKADKVRTERIVTVPVPVNHFATWDARPPVERRAAGLFQSASADLQRLRARSQEAAGTAAATAGATAGAGLAGLQSLASTLTRKASVVPLQARLASQQLVMRTQDYGSRARAGLQAHPAAGVGGALGIGALLTAAWLQRRSAAADAGRVTTDASGNGVAWRHDQLGGSSRVFNTVAARPVASAAVVLGLGALTAAVLQRRSY